MLFDGMVVLCNKNPNPTPTYNHTYIHMGNIDQCSQGCYSWLKGYNQTVTKLRAQYRHKYKNTPFYQNCAIFVEQLHRVSQNGHGFDDEVQNYKGSLIDSVHYEEGTLERGQSGAGNEGLPTRITSLTGQQKKQLISELIKKSYILLDISDIFQDHSDTIVYQSQIKHKIFQNDESMMTESFFEGRDALADSLRKFDTATIYKLEKYVEMAENIKKTFDLSTESLLSKFLLHLKSRLIQLYNTTEDIDRLFKNTHTMVQILQNTIIILFDLPVQIRRSDAHIRKNSNSSTGSSGTWQQNNEHGIQFLNHVNLSTLVTCIVFDQPDFHEFYEKAILGRFKDQIGKYKKQTVVTDQFFVGRVLGDNGNLGTYFEPTLVGLFNKRADESNSFQKTIKMFSKLPNKLPPVLKLKLLAEVQKQFLRQLSKLQQQKNLQLVYDRSIAQLMASWLLNRDKGQGVKNIASVVMAYGFVHSLYRMGRKGSTVLSYVEVVEKILGWTIPVQ